MPLQEIITFPSSERFVSDPLGALGPVKQHLAAVDDCTGVFAGVAEEEGIGHITILWKSSGHLDALQDRPNYAQVLGLPPQLANELKSYSLELNDDPINSLTAPVTEVAIMVLKPGRTKAEVDALLPDDLPLLNWVYTSPLLGYYVYTLRYSRGPPRRMLLTVSHQLLI